MATFGDTATPSDWDNLAADYTQTSKFTLASGDTFTKMFIYMDGNGVGSGDQPLKALIYSNNAGVPLTLLGVSNEVVVTDGQSAGWVEFTLTSPTVLTAADYWLGFIAGTPNNAARRGYTTVTSNRIYNPDAYSDGPLAPWTNMGAGQDNLQISVYAETSTASYESEVLADDPVVYWKLDEASGDFADASGNGETATALGSAYTYQQPPGINERFSITGSATSRAGPASATPYADPNTFSFEAWIKSTEATNNHGIFEFGANAAQLVLNGSTGKIQLKHSHVGLGTEVASTIAANDGDWHHVVATSDGVGTAKIYIDGVDRSDTVAGNSFDANTNQWGFGATWIAGHGSPDANSYFTGSLDELAVYDAALSAARIVAHYEAGQVQEPQVLSMQAHISGSFVW